MKKLISLLLITFVAASAWAGGPLRLAGPSGRTPVTYPNGGQNITFNLDQGNLGSRSKAQADAIFDQAFVLWNNVPTSTAKLTRGPDLPVDVTAANYTTYLSRYSDGLNPIIYDTDGSITDTLFGVGAKNSILGFAGSAFFSSTATYAEGEAVINGFLSISNNTLAVVLTHEIGHFIGLDHTQLDDTQGLSSANYALMYPIAFRNQVSLHEDDVASISALYPTGINAAYGTLSGVFTQVNATAILGANIWARETTTGKVYSNVSDFLREGTGFYRMLLPPGTYTLNAESIQTNFTAGSSVGPFAANSSSISFLAPHPITPVAFQGSTPGQVNNIKIIAGCAANITFRLDGSGAVNSTTCVNRAPVAQNGNVTTPSNTVVNGIVSVSDADNDPLIYRIVNQGTRGTATMNASTGAFIYTPLGTSSGSDSFTFAANDGTVDSNIASISVTISNVAPNIVTLTSTPQILLDNATSQLQVVASDSDGPSPLSYQWTILSGGGSLSNSTIANPIYTPANVSVSTPVTINVAVSDGLAAVNRSITLTVNDAGVPAAVLSLTIRADNASEVYLNGVLLGTSRDWSQTKNYSAALQNGVNVLAVKGIDSDVVGGVIAEMSWPGGSAVSGSTWKALANAPGGWESVGFNDSAWPAATGYGRFGVGPWFSSEVGFPVNSSAEWIWTADNINDNTVYLRYTFTVGNVPLNLSTTSLNGGTVGAVYNQTLTAVGGTTPYTWSIVTGSLPAGLSLNSSTGVITGTPTTAGTSNFNLQVRDNAGTTTSKALTISIGAANIAPNIVTLTSTPQILLDNATSQLQVVASDSDGPSPLSYQWTILSGGGSLSNSTIANPIYTPANVSVSTPVTINVAVSDGLAAVNRSITLTVNDAGVPAAVLSLTIRADNASEVYLNGVLLGTSRDWSQTKNYSAALQNGVNVLAVKGIDSDVVGGVIAEMSWPGGSAVSGSTWKALANAPGGWESVGFNDSAWPAATGYGRFGVGPWFSSEVGFPVNSSAEWIWTADNINDNTVYLRYTFTVP